jgi:hypothetical protein
MRARTTMLVVVSTLAVSVGGLVLVGAPSWIASAGVPEFPVVCKVAGTVTFSPPLTKTGTPTTNRAAVTTATITGGDFKGCLSAAPSGPPTHGTLPTMTLSFPAAKLGGGHYATGYCPTFMTDAPKALRHVPFVLSWSGGGVTGTSVFTTKKVATATNTSGEVGFSFVGSQVSGLFPEKSLNQVTMFFDATDSSALATGCAASQTVTAPTLDATAGVAIL